MGAPISPTLSLTHCNACLSVCLLGHRRKFSASAFWPDCRENKVTGMLYASIGLDRTILSIFCLCCLSLVCLLACVWSVVQYIGELCRYLLNVAPDSNDGKQQTVRSSYHMLPCNIIIVASSCVHPLCLCAL